MEPIASFSGLATGIDSAALISQLVQLERIPIKRLETKQQDLKSMSSRLGTIATRLEALKTAGEDIDARDELLASTATSSDEDRLRVSATGSAPLGTYRLEVTQLAGAERTYSNGFAGQDTAGLFGTGTVSIQVGADAAIDITVDATDTLGTIATKINASGSRVNAAVIFDGTEYRLQVSGEDTGAANAVTFSETGTSLGLIDPANELVAAQDALFSVDGLAMTRSSNQVANAIPGVTIDLFATTDTLPVTINVGRDTESSIEKVQSFVDAFNDIVRGINSEFVFAGAARVGNSLAGDSMLRNLQSRLSRDIIDPIAGLAPPFDRLSALGIRVQNDGTLEVDEEVMTAALAADPDGVVDFLAGDGVTTGFLERLTSTVDAYAGTAGLIEMRQDGMSDQVDDLDTSILSMENRLEKFESNLRHKFTNLELVVSGMQAQQAQMLAILSALPTFG